MSSIEKKQQKEKEPKKEKKPKKEKEPKKEKQEYTVELDKYTLEQIQKLKVENVFVVNSLLKNEKIINGMIYQYKILDYKCSNVKCSITSEWLSNPINLILVRKNNKQEDLRINNLEYSCYNCYFQKNNNENIFNKIKKSAILECKICNFNINNMSEIYKELGLCKLCLSKHKSSKSNKKQIDLFRDTFDNSLTTEDIDNEYNCKNRNKYQNINSIGDMDNMSILLSNNFMDNETSHLLMNSIDDITEETFEKMFNKVSTSQKNKETSKYKGKDKNTTSITSNINNNKNTVTQKINIELDSMDINTINKVKKMMKE